MGKVSEILQSFSKIDQAVKGKINIGVRKWLVRMGCSEIHCIGSCIATKLHITGFVTHHDSSRKINGWVNYCCQYSHTGVWFTDNISWHAVHCVIEHSQT